jgi:hypothetical protein
MRVIDDPNSQVRRCPISEGPGLIAWILRRGSGIGLSSGLWRVSGCFIVDVSFLGVEKELRCDAQSGQTWRPVVIQLYSGLLYTAFVCKG